MEPARLTGDRVGLALFIGLCGPGQYPAAHLSLTADKRSTRMPYIGITFQYIEQLGRIMAEYLPPRPPLTTKSLNFSCILADHGRHFTSQDN